MFVFTGADPYCIISCEGESVTTAACKNTVNPEWNDGALFYRKDPIGSPIKIQVREVAVFIPLNMERDVAPW